MKTELIAFAVRALSEKTTLIPKPDPMSDLITTIFGGEPYDRRLAKEIESESERAVAAVKKMNLHRKFNRIVNHR